MSNIADGAEFLFHILGGEGAIGELIDLGSLPRKHKEIERKYKLKGKNGHTDGGMMAFMHILEPFLTKQKITIEHASPFVGIDQYLVLKTRGFEVSFRFRVGANKLPELTAKFSTGHGSNEIRGEVDLNVSGNDPESIRTMLTLISKLSEQSVQFAVRQDGNLWKILDPELGVLEIVCYRVAGIKPRKRTIPFVEIESKAPDPEEALRAIRVYEKGLKLRMLRCEESIAQLFAPMR